MSTHDSDAIMSQLLEMGFAEPQAAAYATAYHSFEGAFEALMNDTQTQGANPMPVPAHVAAQPPRVLQAAAAAVNAAAFATALQVNDFEERKETISDILQPTRWMPFEQSSIRIDGETEDGEVDCQFEVLHSSIATPSTTALNGWTIERLHASFYKTRSLSQDSDLNLNIMSIASSTADINDQPCEPPSNASSGASTPRFMADPQDTTCGDDDPCCVCLDAPKDTLLLPCQHLAMCSSCALNYFTRTRQHNHAVYLTKAEESVMSMSHPWNSLQKLSSRICACPQCSTSAQFAIRKRSQGESKN